MTDDEMNRISPSAAKHASAQVMLALADLLERDDPMLRDRQQRLDTAKYFRQISGVLMRDDLLSHKDIEYWEAWTANLGHLLGFDPQLSQD